MGYEIEYLCIPLDSATKLDLPCIVYDSLLYEVRLEKFSGSDMERAFRLRFEDDQQGGYRATYLDQRDVLVDDNISFALHGMQLKLRIIPKNGSIDEYVREKLSVGLECALGFLDEYVSWVYKDFSTISSRGAYRSHYSARIVHEIGEEEIRIIRSILAYEESGELPQHKFDTLRALLSAARNQSGASDVACVLYFSILEAIFVDDNKELGYKLSMRLVSHNGEDFEYAKRIAKLYGKRGKVIHGSNKGNVFTQNDYLLIESLAKDAFVDLVTNPLSFTERELDSRLLR